MVVAVAVEEVMVEVSDGSGSRSSINSGRSGSCCCSSSKYGSNCLIVSLIFWRSSDR